KSHHRGGAYHRRHWLSLAKEPKQLRGSWRKLLRSHPLRRSQAIPGEAAPTTRAQGNSGTDGSCLSHRFPQLFSREKVAEGWREHLCRRMVVTLRQTKSSDHDAVIHSRRTRLPTLVATTYRQRTCPGTQVFP